MKEKIARTYHALLAVCGIHMYAPYRTDDGRLIDLIRPGHFSRLPNDTTLMSISGHEVRKGLDNIDGDTRNGFMSYGVPSSSRTMRGHYGRLRTQ